MTIHLIHSFQEENEKGYVLACDSATFVKGKFSRMATKGFVGRNIVGLPLGRYIMPELAEEEQERIYALDWSARGVAYKNAYNHALASKLENIVQDKKYAELPEFRNMDENNKRYCQLIAKSDPETARLFYITNFPGYPQHQAILLDQMSNDTSVNESHTWCQGTGTSSSDHPYLMVSGEPINFNRALVSLFLMSNDPKTIALLTWEGYDPGDMHYYIASTRRIGKVGKAPTGQDAQTIISKLSSTF